MSTIYTSLRDPILGLAASLSSQRATSISTSIFDANPSYLPALAADELRSQIEPIWARVKAQLDEQDRIRNAGFAKNGESSTSTAASVAGAEGGENEEVAGEGTPASKADERAKKRQTMKLDLIRGWMDLIGKEVVVLPIASGELDESDDPSDQCLFITAIQDRLDIALTLYEAAYASLEEPAPLEPGAIFIPLLEELVELVSVESWRTLWGYVETRSKRFTKNMPANRGKALPLLRFMNGFLRFLPRTPVDLVFRGRVHQFASGVIGVADKSAINLRGEFAGMEVEWDEAYGKDNKNEVEGEGEGGEGGAGGEGGDVEMRDDKGDKSQEGEEASEPDEKKGKEEEKAEAEKEKKGTIATAGTAASPQDPSTSPTFYANLWSLQKYFANPATLDGPSVPVEIEVALEEEPSTKEKADDAASKGKSDAADSASQSQVGKAKRTKTRLTVETPLETFKRKTELILPVLFAQTAKERAMGGLDMDDPSLGSSAGRKRKRGDANPALAGSPSTLNGTANDNTAAPTTTTMTGGASSTFFHPRYLTPRNLLSYELADLSFRRQILVQYFILFQFLLLLSPENKYSQKPQHMGMISKNFILSQEDQDWAKGKVRAIMQELNGMGRDGRRWCDAVLGVITREKHYATWKMEGCPESTFDVPPLPASPSADEAAKGWAEQLKAPRPFPFKVGSRSLSMMWRGGFEGLDQLRGWKRASTFDTLEEEIRRMVDDLEDDQAMGKVQSKEEAREFAEAKTKLTWRATRLAARTNLRHFRGIASKRDIGVLVKFIKEDEERLAKLEADRAAGRMGGAEGALSGVKVESQVGTPADHADVAEVAEGADTAEGADAAAADVGTPDVEGGGSGDAADHVDPQADTEGAADGTVDSELAAGSAGDKAEEEEVKQGDSDVQTPPPASPALPDLAQADVADTTEIETSEALKTTATTASESSVRSEPRKVSGARRGAEEMDDAGDRAEGVKRVRTGEDVEMGDGSVDVGNEAGVKEETGRKEGEAAGEAEEGERRVSTPPAE